MLQQKVKTMFRAREGWVRVSKRAALVQTRRLCTNNNKPTTTTNNSDDKSVRDVDAYRQLDKLDFMTAAKILFTTPPKKKKFGIDFHLVQLFFALMPSLAVYLVAQYARYEIRRMEAELELKKKAEEAAKAKEMEASAQEVNETGPELEILQVKARLDKLEETVKEFVVESKKHPDSSITEDQEDGMKEKHLAAVEPSNTQKRLAAGNSATSEHISKQKSVEVTPSLGQERVSGSAPVTDASQNIGKNPK